jgi:hypothetical protein
MEPNPSAGYDSKSRGRPPDEGTRPAAVLAEPTMRPAAAAGDFAEKRLDRESAAH